jgi:hypothetical protein
MDRSAKLIEETTAVREVKRALSVKLGAEGMATAAMGAVLRVTPGAVRKGRQRSEREGGAGVQGRYRGSQSDLRVAQRRASAEGLGAPEALPREAGRAESAARSGSVYQAKHFMPYATRGG